MARNRDSGLNSSESFASYDRGSWSSRTSQPSLFGGSTPFSERWPRAGTMRSGIAYPHLPSVPLTGAIDSSSSPGDLTSSELWPTATAGDAKCAGRTSQMVHNPKAGMSLTDAIRLWATPLARDEKDRGDFTRVNARAGRPPDTLPRQVQAFEGPKRGGINPEWVGRFMGFPEGWLG